MTRTFGTNDQNDIYLGPDGNLVFLSGLDAIVAACETASKAQYGEMVLATGLGIPNFETIWVGTPNYKQFDAALRSTLLAVPGVLNVQSLTYAVSEGTLFYTAEIVTQFGIGVVTNG